MNIERTQEEIDALLNAVTDQYNEGGSKYPGMSYEEGIINVLGWLSGYTDDHPYEEE